MSTSHNRRFAVAQRRQRITELYLQGWSQAAIAAELNISQSTVSEDVQHVRRKWEQSSICNFDELRTRELQKLEYIEREAWGAWQRSQKPVQSAVVTGEGIGQQTRKSMKQQIGDPRFLQQVANCITQRRALTGLDVMPASKSSEGQFDASITLEVRQQRIQSLIDAFYERDRIGEAGTRPDSGQPGDVCRGDEPRSLENGPASEAAEPGDPGHLDGERRD